ncbi:MAG: S-adenosyl-l-methionine hydroxide adenosyltransferase family protein [Acidimicrobiales bacterium]
MRDHVALLTDYGLDDEFVGVLKSVITDIAPHVRITDITHGVPPFDIRWGSLALARAIQYVPAGVIVAVVDPGVGSNRRAVAIEVAGGEGIIIGPDNGLLPSAAAMAGGAERVFVLSNGELHLDAPGTTFAGRDVFAPVAAFLCNGGSIEEVGEEIDPAQLMPGLVPLPQTFDHPERGTGMRCEVTWVDRYGNCQLNVGPDEIAGLGPVLRVVVGDEVRSARLVDHFAALTDGAIGAVVDSYGMVALAVNRGSAAASLGLSAGDEVVLHRGDDTTTSPVILRGGPR